MTKEEHEGILKAIMETGGDVEATLNLLQKLRDNFDEMTNQADKNSEPDGDENGGKADGSHLEPDGDEPPENEDVDNEGEKEVEMIPKSEYDDLKKKYIERFFTTPEEVKTEAAEDVKRDGEEQDFDDLFKRKEG